MKQLRKSQFFTPTPAMRIYAYYRGKLPSSTTDLAISNDVGVCAETISRWKHIKGFSAWLETEVLTLRMPIHSRLEQIALQKIDDFKYWHALAIKYEYLEPTEDEEKELIYTPRPSIVWTRKGPPNAWTKLPKP